MHLSISALAMGLENHRIIES